MPWKGRHNNRTRNMVKILAMMTTIMAPSAISLNTAPNTRRRSGWVGAS